jgi:hypothetical protein
MTMKLKLVGILLVAAISVSAASYRIEDLETSETSTGINQTSDVQKEFRWIGRIAAGRTVAVRGVNGNIRAEPSNGDQVEVVANKHGRRSNPDGVEIKVVEHDGGVTICAVYPSPEGKPANDCRPGKDWSSHVNNNDVQVDFMVRVPQGINLNARTVNGEIETGLIGGDAEAYTVNGSIRVSATGHAEAKTVNGSINATMGRADWTDAVDFKTVNGEIVLNLPADTSTEVHADTLNGDIATDFPLTVQGRISRRTLNGTIGSGGRKLNLATINGGIRLRRAS